MRHLIWFTFAAVLTGLIAYADGAHAQSPDVQSPTIASKTPVFAGACSSCPWGELAEFTREAMAPLGYQVQVCNICNLVDSPRYVSERRVPPPVTDRHRTQYGVFTRPDSQVDFGATERMRLHWAYHGTREYTGDTMGKRLRLIATIDDPMYLVVAVRKSLNSTDLGEILKRPKLRLRSEGNTPVQVLLEHYGTSKADIEKSGGTFEAPAGFEIASKPYDIIITPMGTLANNPEGNAFYNLPQSEEVTFLSLPEDLREHLVKELGFVRVKLPTRYFRGLNAPVDTVARSGNAIIARDDAPEAFVYDVAKAIDLHRDRLKWFIRPYSYDSRNVWKAFDVPLHPGAERYYREVGYMK